MSGSAGLFSKKKYFFYLVGSPKVGGAGDGKHKKKYGHPNATMSCHNSPPTHITSDNSLSQSTNYKGSAKYVLIFVSCYVI